MTAPSVISPHHSPASQIPLIRHPSVLPAAALLLAALLGFFTLQATVFYLTHLWDVDPLRSVGALLPPISLVLVLRVWRQEKWAANGSCWGLVAVLAATALSWLFSSATASYRFTPRVAVGLIQPGVVLFLYGSGVVVALGGWRLFRRALFPLALLLLVNPVPHLFNRWVDLPLQLLSAEVARGFSHLLGLKPTGDELRLLFTPQFGMMIVPGCNGMRGAVTMGYLILIAGYLRRLRPLPLLLSTLAAVALGYLLNFLRLCLLVLYYDAGVHHPAWQRHGTAIDYAIGATTFLLLSGVCAMLLRESGGPQIASPPIQPNGRLPLLRQTSSVLLFAAMLCLAAIAAPQAWARLRAHPTRPLLQQAAAALPLDLGSYHRTSVTFERDLNGTPVWVFGEYASPTNRPIRVGLWLAPYQHYAIQSAQVHGRFPVWTGALQTADAQALPTLWATFLSRDDAGAQIYEAETTCVVSQCRDTISGFQRRGLAIATSVAPARRLSMMVQIPEVAAGTPKPELDALALDLVRKLKTSEMLAIAGQAPL